MFNIFKKNKQNKESGSQAKISSHNADVEQAGEGKLSI